MGEVCLPFWRMLALMGVIAFVACEDEDHHDPFGDVSSDVGGINTEDLGVDSDSSDPDLVDEPDAGEPDLLDEPDLPVDEPDIGIDADEPDVAASSTPVLT